MNPIICVTEFTAHTLQAAQVSAALARHWAERVVLVRSVDEREQFPFPLRSRLVEPDWQRLSAEAQRLRDLGMNFEEEVLRGMPEDGIAGFAWSLHARMIVVGCEPTHLLDRWALGSVAEDITDTSLVPVLVIRSAQPFLEYLNGKRPLNVLVGIDPVARDDAVLNRLDELRELGPCSITATYVADPEIDHSRPELAPSAYREHEIRAARDSVPDVSRDLAARHIAIGEVETAGHVEAALVDRAHEEKADLVVITTHPRRDLTLLPRRCLAKSVLRRAPMNVLCVPDADIEPPRIHATASDRAVS